MIETAARPTRSGRDGKLNVGPPTSTGAFADSRERRVEKSKQTVAPVGRKEQGRARFRATLVRGANARATSRRVIVNNF
jgi:hypothetical protein